MENRGHHAPLISPTPGQWSPPRGNPRLLVLNQSMLHIIGVPLLILGSVGVGFVMVVLRDVLLPFVIAVFFTFLLRPLVNVLTTPYARICPCCAVPSITNSSSRHNRHHRHTNNGYARIPTSRDRDLNNNNNGGTLLSSSGSNKHSDDLLPLSSSSSSSSGIPSSSSSSSSATGGTGTTVSGTNSNHRRSRGGSPAKYPRTLRGMVTRICANASDLVFTRSTSSSSSNNTVSSSSGRSTPPLGTNSGSGNTGSSTNNLNSHNFIPSLEDADCACCCGGSFCTFTRVPRWFAVLISLCVAMSILGGLILMIADAIQRFQQDSLPLFVEEASVLVDRAEDWLSVFGIHVEGAAILEAIKQSISVPFLVQTTVTVIVDGVGNALLVLLLVLYLLAESSSHAPGSLRAKVDDQIQRYVVIKTVISACQGIVAYIILGIFLHVRMAHLFGILHFLLNYIPTAGPVVATIIPIPVILLDPDLSAAAKITAIAGPTGVHFLIGNFIEPLVFGSSMELHPVTVLLALALWYALWGIPGAILAVPITAVIRIIMGSIDHPYAVIVITVLEGRLSAAMEDINTTFENTTMEMDNNMGSSSNGGGHASSSHGGMDIENGQILPVVSSLDTSFTPLRTANANAANYGYMYNRNTNGGVLQTYIKRGPAFTEDNTVGDEPDDDYTNTVGGGSNNNNNNTNATVYSYATNNLTTSSGLIPVKPPVLQRSASNQSNNSTTTTTTTNNNNGLTIDIENNLLFDNNNNNGNNNNNNDNIISNHDRNFTNTNVSPQLSPINTVNSNSRVSVSR